MDTILIDESIDDRAEKIKTEGNNFFKQKNYLKAIHLYSQAIDLDPNNAIYYTNRSASFYLNGDVEKSLEDAEKAIQIDPTFSKGYLRQGKCYLVLGEYTKSRIALKKYSTLDPTSKVADADLDTCNRMEQLEANCSLLIDNGESNRASCLIPTLTSTVPYCNRIKLLKAEILVYQKKYEEALQISNDLLKLRVPYREAQYIQALVMYYRENLDKAEQIVKNLIQHLTEHKKANQLKKKISSFKQNKESGNAAFQRGQYPKSLEFYSAALETDKTNAAVNAKLYYNRALVYSKLGKNDEALNDCNRAIEADSEYLKAYLKRASVYTAKEKFQEAVYDYEHIVKLNNKPEHIQFLSEAKKRLERSKRVDYYKVLGVSRDADQGTIKRAFRKLALIHHPDKHASSSDEDKVTNEAKFKQINLAYDTLSDSRKKTIYDSGGDPSNDDHGGMFRSGFGGGGYYSGDLESMLFESFMRDASRGGGCNTRFNFH